MHALTTPTARRAWLLGLACLALLTFLPDPARGQQAQATPLRVNIGETLTIGSSRNLPIREIIVSRPNIVEVSEVNPQTPTVIKVRGINLGSVRLSVYDRDGIRDDYDIVVIPSLSSLTEAIRAQFPQANINIQASAGGVLLVTGVVNTSEEIDSLRQFASAFTGLPTTSIITNLRVAGVMQVQLEVCIARVERTEARNMAFDWIYASQQDFIQSTVSNLFTPIAAAISIPRTTAPVVGTVTQAAGAATLSFGITNTQNAFFGYLGALHTEGVAKIISQPTLTTLSGRPAELIVGSEVPFGTAGGSSGGGSIAFRPVGTVLAFLPVVLGDGKIRIEIDTQISNVGPEGFIQSAGIVAPLNIQTNRVRTAVELENGQTIALCGLMESVPVGTTRKVPCLGDLPFFGTMFRTVTYRETERELLIVITPRLVDPLDCSQLKTRLPGQETRAPTDFELFLEGILEAPRGPRELCPDGVYRPAHYWLPNGGRCAPAGTYGKHAAGGHGPAAAGAVCVEPRNPAFPVAEQTAPPAEIKPVSGVPMTRAPAGPARPGSRATLLTAEPMPAAAAEKLAPPAGMEAAGGGGR